MSPSSHARRRGRVTFPAPPGAAAITVAAPSLAGCVGAGCEALDVVSLDHRTSDSTESNSNHRKGRRVC